MARSVFGGCEIGEINNIGRGVNKLGQSNQILPSSSSMIDYGGSERRQIVTGKVLAALGGLRKCQVGFAGLGL